jgi:16S rRNA (uracil1498-N3)-methyltransferase
VALPRLFLGTGFDVNAHEPLTLDRERSHYLCRVLRQRSGADIELCDGVGNAWQARILRADPRRCSLQLTGAQRTQPRPVCRLHLGVALLKGDRQDWVLQKATELGATDIWLLASTRSEARIHPERLENRLQHFERVLVSACEQSGRLHLPQLHQPAPLESFWSNLTPSTSSYCLQPGAPGLAPPASPCDLAIVTGPEGGFDDAELALADRHGAALAGLGDLVLRADTAPIVALGIVRQSWGWSAP